MKIFIKYSIITKLCLVLALNLILAQEQQKEEMEKQIPAIPEVLIEDSILIKEFFGKQPAIKIRQDISVNFDMIVDLEKKTATQNYMIKNLLDKQVDFEFTTPSMEYKRRLLQLDPKKVTTEKVTKEISVAQLSDDTKFVQIRPYLLVKETDTTDVLLVTNYAVNIEVRLPPSAKMLKSSIPFTEKQKNVLSFDLDRVKIVPPIYLWYTTAEAKIDVSKEFSEEGKHVTINIEIKNIGSASIQNLLVTAQFPATLYTYLAEESDGEILLQDEIMYKWSAKIDNIARDSTYTLRYTVEKVNQIPYHDYELMVYDDKGELIAVE